MKTASYKFNASEIATILHALRVIQEQAEGPKLCVYGSCEHFDEFPELTNAQIDALCMRINPLDADEHPQTDEHLAACPSCMYRHDSKAVE